MEQNGIPRLEKSIVRGEIRKNRFTLDLLSKSMLKLHLKLAHVLDHGTVENSGRVGSPKS
jgi:hypothetical protein